MSYFAILSSGSLLAALASVGLARRRARRRWQAAVDAYAEREIVAPGAARRRGGRGPPPPVPALPKRLPDP